MAMNATPVPPDGIPHDQEQGPSVDPADDEVLPCGRSLADVWDDRLSDDPTDGHPAHCPHCAAALAELRVLDDFVGRARSTDAELPDAEAVTARVMDIVRLELRPGRTLPLGEPDEDSWVFESAAAKAFRAAADALPGVRAGSCRIAPVESEARVEVAVTVALTWNLQEASDAVRGRIFAAARDVLGMPLRSVDVRVTDILDEEPERDGGYGRGEANEQDGSDR
ncbi:hypothetical protein [Streptomyces sp. H27-C3]|uniref:hypothetical protein n=1 Tax=Streptomyces sp. H27-C3 TaxID=3046305 RepID=UPI0024BAF558|nr:hypothetical protein [Streptomyces sp. H27-C3]MDJ0463032.1 hypothetical protein [Streptomyces sp. H27-C3]